MNSIQDFAALRPEPDSPTDAELDRLWARAIHGDIDESTGLEPESGTASPDTASPEFVFADSSGRDAVEDQRASRRRFALLGAAATLIVGVAAVAVFVGQRSDESHVALDRVAPSSSSPAPALATTVPDTTVPDTSVPSDIEVAASLLGVNVAADEWEVTASETVSSDGNPGGQWHYRTPDGGELDIEFTAGGEKGYLDLIRAEDSTGSVELLGDFVQVARFPASGLDWSRYRFIALVDEFDREWTVTIDVRPIVDDERFFALLEQINLADGDARRITASELTDDVILATAGPAGPVEAPALVIGDSVSLGAFDELDQREILLDAVESRSFADGLDVIQWLLRQRVIAHPASGIDTLVVDIGSNGSIRSDDLDTALDWLRDVPNVILVTSAVERDYAGPNNDLLFAAADSRSNVTVLDWANLAADCPGECFYADQIHLTPDGAAYYAEAIAFTVGV